MMIGKTVEGRFRFSADEGGGAAAPASAPASESAAPASAPAASEAPATPAAADPDAQAFRDSVKKSIEKWQGRDTDKGFEDVTPRPTPLHDAEPEKPAASEAPGAEPETTEPPAGANPPVPEPSLAEEMVKIGEQEYPKNVLGDIIDFARKANELLEKEQSFFTADRQKLDAEKAEVAKINAQIHERLNSPDMVLLNALQSDPELRDKFVEIATQRNPELSGQIDHHKQQQKISDLERQVEELRGGFQARTKSEQESMAANARKAHEESVTRFTNEVSSFAGQKAQEFGVANELVDMVLNDAAVRVQAGAIQPTVADVNKYVGDRLASFSKQLKDAEARGRGGYLSEKKKDPVAPPVGGGVPRVSPDKPADFKAAGRNLLMRIQALEK